MRIRLAQLEQDRVLATSGSKKKNFQLGQSYSYIMRKFWYHQICIQNNLGFMVHPNLRIHWYLVFDLSNRKDNCDKQRHAVS